MKLRTKLINLYNKELLNSANKTAMNNFIEFLETASDKEILKFPVVLVEFLRKQYISHHQLKFIQTKYYSLIKYNSLKDRKDKNNISLLFGFIKEESKGYCFPVSLNSKYSINKQNSKYTVSAKNK